MGTLSHPSAVFLCTPMENHAQHQLMQQLIGKGSVPMHGPKDAVTAVIATVVATLEPQGGGPQNGAPRARLWWQCGGKEGAWGLRPLLCFSCLVPVVSALSRPIGLKRCRICPWICPLSFLQILAGFPWGF